MEDPAATKLLAVGAGVPSLHKGGGQASGGKPGGKVGGKGGRGGRIRNRGKSEKETDTPGSVPKVGKKGSTTEKGDDKRTTSEARTGECTLFCEGEVKELPPKQKCCYDCLLLMRMLL